MNISSTAPVSDSPAPARLPARARSWLLARRRRSVAAAIVVGGLVAASVSVSAVTHADAQRRAVDAWHATQTSLKSIQARYDTVKKVHSDRVASTTAALEAAQALEAARDGSLSDDAWKPLQDARAAAEHAVEQQSFGRLTPAPKLDGTELASYERARERGAAVAKTNTRVTNAGIKDSAALADARRP